MVQNLICCETCRRNNFLAMDFSKQILNKEYEKCIQDKTEKVYRRIPDSLRGIWVELDNDHVNIGIHM